MMHEAARNREWVSALADGQLRGEEFASTVDWVNATDEARRTWHTYHLVGDVLRSGESVVSAYDADFLGNLKLRLQRETPQLCPTIATDSVADEQDVTGAGVQIDLDHLSSNDSRFRWKLLAGLASLSTVVLMGWQLVGGWDDRGAAAQLAQAPVPSLWRQAGSTQPGATAEPQRMIRDPQLDALLAAHKEFAGMSALQGPAGFLRNATFDGVVP